MDSVVFHLCLDLNITWPGFSLYDCICIVHCTAAPRTPQYLLHIVFLCVLCGKCTPGSRSSSDLVSTSADSLYIHQLILKCRRLAYGSFQLTHVMWWPCHWSWASNGCQIEDKKLLQHSQLAPFSLCTDATNIEWCRELVCSLPYMLLVQPL